MTEFINEIECDACEGNGWTLKRTILLGRVGSFEVTCAHCNGHGWRAMTEDEASDRAADAYSAMCEGEPPITMQERHEAAWKQKQESRK